MDFYIQFWS